MGENSAIGWTDHTFNTHWGCTKVLAPNGERSECDHCYAETLAIRWGYSETGSKPALWGKDADRRTLSDAYWKAPLTWDADADRLGRPALVFCSSMADVFEARDDLDPVRARLWDLIAQTPNLIWLLLTKRPEHVNRLVPPAWLGANEAGYVQTDATHLVPIDYVSPAEWCRLPSSSWPTNVWIGTSVGTQRSATIRLPRLLEIPAHTRFLSCEPLLEPVDLSRWLYLEWMDALGDPEHPTFRTDDGAGGWGPEMIAAMQGQRPGIHWIIAGGESGPGWQPMEHGWARDLRDQALAQEIPFFFKQDSALHSGTEGPPDLETYKQWPASAGDRT